jgi:hypothetical protein
LRLTGQGQKGPVQLSGPVNRLTVNNLKDSNLPAMYNPADIVDQIRASTNSNVMSSDPSATAGTSSSTDVDSIDVDDYELGNTVTNMNVNSAASSATISTSSITDCAWQCQ